MNTIYHINNIESLNITINKPSLIFLRWDLWAWKTTISKYIINELLWINEKVTSPTYTYYNKYNDIYHFDLYRLNNYDEFFAIWWEDILDNNNWVIIVEWPDLLEKYYSPDIEIILWKTSNDDEREIEIIYKK
jgi:tRNA threonylcarbamoyladenosine biosynthesis protein TsaE